MSTIQALRARINRLEGRACLICGRDEPCELNENIDNIPNWPGSPCTFDPSAIEAAQRFMRERDHWRHIATDLLEALEALEGCVYGFQLEERHPTIHAAARRARAAIEKARGE